MISSFNRAIVAWAPRVIASKELDVFGGFPLLCFTRILDLKHYECYIPYGGLEAELMSVPTKFPGPAKASVRTKRTAA